MAAFIKRILNTKQAGPQTTWLDSWLAYREREHSVLERERWIAHQQLRVY